MNARLVDGESGGVQSIVLGLAHAFSQLPDGDEDYLFLTFEGEDGWLRPFISGPCSVLVGPKRKESQWRARVKSRLPTLRDAWRTLSPLLARWTIRIPVSDGMVEAAGADVIHFPFQSGFLTTVPSIYHPWDLQHRHLPQLFNPRERTVREIRYQALCRQAAAVCLASRWSASDIAQSFGIAPMKLYVIPIPSPLTAYPTPDDRDLRLLRSRYQLPEQFIYYPAHTWPHKNHIGLLRALACIRDRDGVRVPLVCSGGQTEYFNRIQSEIRALNLGNDVVFVGHVRPVDLHGLYKLARAVVYPSRFEGWGLPVLEAFEAGVPVACANVTSLPEQAGRAAILFNPEDMTEMADAIRVVWSDRDKRDQLVAEGRKRAASISWPHTARTFRALYRSIAGRQLSGDDHALLAEANATQIRAGAFPSDSQ